MRKWRSIVVFASFLALLGCQSSPAQRTVTPPPPVASTGGSLVNEYLIGVDDRLQVAVWRNPELSVEVPVRPDGYISVPLAGEVPAGGLTPQQVSRLIEGRLREYIKTPNVSIIVTELVSNQFLSRVRVTGAVQSPLSQAFRPGMTVLDLVLEAGGVTDFARLNRAALYRQLPTGQTQAYPVRLDRILQGGDLRTNYPLQPGDVITIPERSF